MEWGGWVVVGKRWNDGEHCTLFPDTTIPNMEKYFHSLTPKKYIYNIIMPFIHRTNTINCVYNMYICCMTKHKKLCYNHCRGTTFLLLFPTNIGTNTNAIRQNFTGIFVRKEWNKIYRSPPSNIELHTKNSNNNQKGTEIIFSLLVLFFSSYRKKAIFHFNSRHFYPVLYQKVLQPQGFSQPLHTH